MKPVTFIIIGIVLSSFIAKAQSLDPILVKKLSVNGHCLCRVTLDSLKNSFNDLKEVPVEEMDLAKGCYGQDSRFIAGKGYATDKQAGMIFQKETESDYISKIRLTKQFKGNLPDGRYIDLSNFLLKDLFVLYPALKDKWGSRGCSDYWNFSNDTLSFYVKIDQSKKPQFPVDEAYYMNKPVEAADLVMSCYGLQHRHEAVVLENANDPVFFIDSVRVNRGVLQNYSPNEIASMTVYKNAEEFAKERYWKYLKSKSDQYAKIVSSPENDANVQYILNKKILKDNFEGELSMIDDKTFKGIQVIGKQELVHDYQINDKEFGVLITSESLPKAAGKK